MKKQTPRLSVPNLSEILSVTTLPQMLATVARANSSRTAVVDGETTVSYAELEKRILCLSAQLHGRGIRRGDRVAILLPNGLEFVTSYFAIVALGAVVVPLNEHYRQTELIYFIEDASAAFVMTAQPFMALCHQVLQSYEKPCRLLLVEDLINAPTPGSLGAFTTEIDPDAPVMYQFSSGSTGRPKRICRTHRNLAFELDSLVQTLALAPEDRFLGVTPFSHVNGLMRSMLAAIRAGGTLYPAAKFERQAVADMIERHRITIFIGVPFMFGVLAKTNFRRRPDFSSLRLCVSASAPMPLQLNRQFHEKFGIYVRQLYGSTETGTISVDLGIGIERSLESVGKPIAGVEVEVYADSGQPAQVNEIGEIAVKSPAAIESYDGCDALNQASFRNGYFFTGDVGWRDREDTLYLTGRKKFFINKGGYKINPREIERLLETHPKVEEAVVIGVRSAFEDEKVQAMLVVNAPCTAQEILEHCRGKIADFKVPSLIEFRERLPTTATGKVQIDLLLTEDATSS